MHGAVDQMDAHTNSDAKGTVLIKHAHTHLCFLLDLDLSFVI